MPKYNFNKLFRKKNAEMLMKRWTDCFTLGQRKNSLLFMNKL